MHIKKLTISEIKDIYNTHLITDFAADEVKPYSRIYDMYCTGIYSAYGLYSVEELLGYAFFVVLDDAVLLDYFAVVKGKRASGFGGSFLSMLKAELSDVHFVLESEYVPSAKSDADRATRIRRINFYKNNGMFETGVRASVFGVDYSIFVEKPMEDSVVRDILGKIYHSMFFPDFSDKYKIW